MVPVQPCSLLQAERQLRGGVCSGAAPERAAHPAGTALTLPEGQITLWGRRFKGPACQRADCGSSNPILTAVQQVDHPVLTGVSLLDCVSLSSPSVCSTWVRCLPPASGEGPFLVPGTPRAQCQVPYPLSRTFLASQPRKDWASWGCRVPVLLARSAAASPTWLLS